MRLWTSVLVGFPLGIVIGLCVGAKASAGPSVVIQSVHAASASYRGGDIEVTMNIRHTKDCPVLVHRWLTRPNPKGIEVWPLLDGFSPPLPIGQDISYVMHIPVPANVPKDRYTLRVRAQEQCTHLPFQPPIRDTSLPVDIENPTDAEPNHVAVPPGASTVLEMK